MHIASLEAAFPSRKLTNDDLLDLVRQHSKNVFDGDLDKAVATVGSFLRYSGAEERYWLNQGETPIDLITRAADKALSGANIEKNDVDLLIYVGVDRGFYEPGNSYFVANALKMHSVHCFDLLDACMSWSRALQIIYSFFRSGVYRTALIVNGEFNQTHEGGPGYPKIFALHNKEQIEWTWPGFTVGEAATATVLIHDQTKNWTFRFSSRNDLADLCNIPTSGYETYCRTSDHIGRNGFGCFTSFGKQMHNSGTFEVRNIFEQLGVSNDKIRAIFPHASSKKSWDDAAKPLGIEHLLYHVYPKYGNLVSASVPAGMALALAEKRFDRGDRIVGWVGSAGMSFGAYSFTY